MDPIAIIIGVVVILILLFVVVKIIKSCLPKIIFGLLIVGGLGYLIWWYISTQ